MADEGSALLSHAHSLGALTAAMSSVLLSESGSLQEAEREARELIAALHDMPRHWAIVERGTAMSPDDWSRALGAARRRAAGAPLQYAAGRASFRHLTLDVDERVLIPRPETELLIDIVLERTAGASGGIAVDVGTGSGAIALALASEGGFARVIATDISRDALLVAEGNLARCGAALRAPVELRAGSLLRPVGERPLRAVVSNPPYISPSEAAALPPSVRDWEPPVALFSGEDGMLATARLVREASDALGEGGLLALEVDARRASLTSELVATHGAYEQVQVLLDLTGRERFVVARRREGVR